MNRVIILGSGSATGVPVIAYGWGTCNAKNPKNRRGRAGVYIEINNTKILADTSADIRNQLIDNNIENIDGVLYTHAHADHIMGIDDLRAFSYNTHIGLNIYGADEHIAEIRRRFGYVFTDILSEETTRRPELIANVIQYGKEFTIGSVKIMPLEFSGHPVPTCGYVFNDGKIVLIPDYKNIPSQTLDYLQKIDVDVLIMPLTNIEPTRYHAGIKDNMEYIRQIKPRQVYFTHMGHECDYDKVAGLAIGVATPAYDGLEIEL